jgi:hypothetical protein
MTNVLTGVLEFLLALLRPAPAPTLIPIRLDRDRRPPR